MFSNCQVLRWKENKTKVWIEDGKKMMARESEKRAKTNESWQNLTRNSRVDTYRFYSVINHLLVPQYAFHVAPCLVVTPALMNSHLFFIDLEFASKSKHVRTFQRVQCFVRCGKYIENLDCEG